MVWPSNGVPAVPSFGNSTRSGTTAQLRAMRRKWPRALSFTGMSRGAPSAPATVSTAGIARRAFGIAILVDRAEGRGQRELERIGGLEQRPRLGLQAARLQRVGVRPRLGQLEQRVLLSRRRRRHRALGAGDAAAAADRPTRMASDDRARRARIMGWIVYSRAFVRRGSVNGRNGDVVEAEIDAQLTAVVDDVVQHEAAERATRGTENSCWPPRFSVHSELYSPSVLSIHARVRARARRTRRGWRRATSASPAAGGASARSNERAR